MTLSCSAYKRSSDIYLKFNKLWRNCCFFHLFKITISYNQHFLIWYNLDIECIFSWLFFKEKELHIIVLILCKRMNNTAVKVNVKNKIYWMLGQGLSIYLRGCCGEDESWSAALTLHSQTTLSAGFLIPLITEKIVLSLVNGFPTWIGNCVSVTIRLSRVRQLTCISPPTNVPPTENRPLSCWSFWSRNTGK